MVERIERAFPGLRNAGYEITSPLDDVYNCIAWAAGDKTRWWWPDESDSPLSGHWPPNVPRLLTLDAFTRHLQRWDTVPAIRRSLKPATRR